VGAESIHVRGFIGIQERWVIFGKHAFHAVDGYAITVRQVKDQFQDRPFPGPGPGDQLFSTQAGNGVAQPGTTRGIILDQLPVHDDLL